MNLVTVKGGKKGQRQLAEQIVGLMLDRLGLGRTRSLTIDLEIIRNLEKNEGVQGWHWEVEDKYDHEIGIDAGLGLRDFITSICHEMVHLKQVYRGEFTQKDGKQFWKGRDHSKDEYDDQPWEKEAYKLQDELALEVWKEIL